MHMRMVKRLFMLSPRVAQLYQQRLDNSHAAPQCFKKAVDILPVLSGSTWECCSGVATALSTSALKTAVQAAAALTAL